MDELTDVRVTTTTFTRGQVEAIFNSANVLTMKMTLLRQQGKLKRDNSLDTRCSDLSRLLLEIKRTMSCGRVSSDSVRNMLVKSSQLMGVIFELFQIANVPREIRYEVGKFRVALADAGITSPIEEMCILEQ